MRYYLIIWKVKVKLSCALTEYHTMKAYWGSRGIAPCILDLGTRWNLVISFTPQPLYAQGKSPGTRKIGVWVGPRAGVDAVVKRNIHSPFQE
jgi:hypothetical protein